MSMLNVIISCSLITFSGGDVPRADEVPVFWGKEMKAYGEYRSRRRVLEKWDRLQGGVTGNA